jgi:alkanesulfonate monooxygenase SsuD/methylene tetrahydromethanopterin reductase-like flavin-dependent oxidoreductase (luciferase family)
VAVAIRRDIHVGADDGDAERVAGPVLERGYRGFDPSACVVGGPARVAERFRELASMGYTDVIVRHLADEQSDVLASFARLAGVRAAILDA